MSHRRPSILIRRLVVSVVALALVADFSLAPAQDTPTQRPDFPGASLVNLSPPFLVGVVADRSLYQEGDKLLVQFMGEREAYLYLIYHQADGKSLLLFPNEARAENRMPAAKPVVIPPAEDPFRFRIRPPFGTEVLQGIASLKPLAELDSLVQKSGRLPIVPRETLARLGARLAAEPNTWTEHHSFISTQSKETPPPARDAARVGLFIGIGKYKHPGYAPTHEELRNSAVVMHELMLKHGKLDPQRTRLVLDDRASKANLRELIAGWLPSISQPGDTVFIYFSGHAGQTPNLDGSESDGQDEVLGPYDLEGTRAGESAAAGRARFRQTNITDDELARWLQELQGRQVVMILDTCHSGGVAEGKLLAESFLTDEATRVKDIAQLNTVILTSCAADEQSLFEGTRNKTMWFTYCLSEAIENPQIKRPLTVQQAHEYTRRRMRELLREGNAGRDQEPTLTDNALLPIVLIP
jgi:hypothetical protein